jgi:hypothetical protein
MTKVRPFVCQCFEEWEINETPHDSQVGCAAHRRGCELEQAGYEVITDELSDAREMLDRASLTLRRHTNERSPWAVEVWAPAWAFRLAGALMLWVYAFERRTHDRGVRWTRALNARAAGALLLRACARDPERRAAALAVLALDGELGVGALAWDAFGTADLLPPRRRRGLAKAPPVPQV